MSDPSTEIIVETTAKNLREKLMKTAAVLSGVSAVVAAGAFAFIKLKDRTETEMVAIDEIGSVPVEPTEVVKPKTKAEAKAVPVPRPPANGTAATTKTEAKKAS